MVQKIGVLGTCFSRNFLSSDPYFNPEYKEDFSVSFTQFHSSIIALMTKPFSLDISSYDDIPDTKKKFVQTDFEKTFFKELKKEKIDYLLIDLYTDALKSVGFIESDVAVTISPIIEQSQIRNDLPFKNMLTHDDPLVFQQRFKEALEAFKTKVLPYIEEERIILNQGQLTTRYFDETRKIIAYSNLDKLAQYNDDWRILDRLFLQVFPNAKTIDMLSEPYIGDALYPFGHSVAHYESKYYKRLYEKFKELTVEK
ncbi:DUF6270 domain-containing protein [Listeria sp. PSOL-1]|uniref:DUF6270 domain-containing protein n=1 Tax=Listeria sp. PSOL-1 TaxID=1844999 RepID=UPI0013D4A6A9|nr:DUF6270 domain-containing protein [Listeria sp. PSOL-1]